MIDPHKLKIYFKPKVGSFREIRRYFSTGIIVLLPMAATVAVIMWLLKGLNLHLLKPLQNFSWFQSFNLEIPEPLKTWVFGIIGLIVIFLGIAGLGMLATNVVGKVIIRWVDFVVKKVPLVNTVYSFVQGLAENLRIMKSGTFNKVILVEYPKEGAYIIAFIAGKLTGDLAKPIGDGKLSIYVPSSPNPTAGFIVIVDEEDTIPLDITPEEALKFIVSGGVLMPETVQGISQE
ncbi:MAG: DUF502 domain-containing protein [bacterium]|nr:DUF502 domain-containing protein [bacterium]